MSVSSVFEEKFFLRRKMNIEKLQSYGFTKENGGYQYETTVMDGQFFLYVSVASGGAVSTKMIDCASKEEYSLHKVASSVGTYVGEVRTTCENVLMKISEQCFDPDIFHNEQTLAVIEYVREKYGDELEFLWEKFPDNAIWRRKDNKKWYAVILTVPKKKLGLNDEKIAEVIDLRLKPEQMAETVDHETYFPGWHMHKKTWYTMILDGSVPPKELFSRIDESYRLAIK